MILIVASALAQDSAGHHLAQARQFAHNRWYGDAAEEIERGLAAPGGTAKFELHWLGAQIYYELNRVDRARELAVRAVDLAPTEAARDQATAFRDFLVTTFGSLTIAAPYPGMRSRLQLELTSMVLDPDGKIVVFGGASMSGARLLADGQLDVLFGDSGYFSSPGAKGTTLWRESDGSYLAVGFAPLRTDAGDNQLAVRFLKLSSSGVPDVSFGAGGYRQVLLPGNNLGLSTIRGAARLADGGYALYVTGLITTYLVRFNADFTLDTASLVDGALKPTSVKLPLFQPAINVGSHLAVTEGNRVWITDINLVTIDPVAPTQKNFFDLITQTL